MSKAKEAVVVKEGWIWKKGEIIRNWRLRYFVLMGNGLLFGYKKERTEEDEQKTKNCFNVRGCQVISVDGIGQHGFLIKCLQENSYIERAFSLQSIAERQEWVAAIQAVACDMVGFDNIKPYSQNSTEDSHTSNGKVTLDDFEYLQVLGRGTFGKVILCREKCTQELYAMKVIKKAAIASPEQQRRTCAENRILKSVCHPFLISLKYSFHTSHHVCLVMDYINGGEIYFHLRRRVAFNENMVRFYGAEIVSALSYLHSLNVLYRDIKTENVLLDSDGHIKLVDFGLCKEEVGCGGRTNSFCGTPEYMAPEVIRRSGHGRGVDWWSLGVLMYEMLCGELPWYHDNINNLYSLILLKHPSFPLTVSNNAKSLLEGLLQKNSKKRLGGSSNDAKDIKDHPFFVSIDWLLLEQLEIPPPFVPDLDDDTDTRYFDLVVACESMSFTPPTSFHLKDLGDDFYKHFSFEDQRD